MKYLIKTNDYASLDAVDYGRVVYDTTNDKVFLQNIGGGVVKYKTIDLGLPSSLLWADRNIGASTPEEPGLYFQWGDTQGYTAEQAGVGEGLKAFRWDDYKFSIDGSSFNFSKYNASDSKTVLDPEDDAAHVNMGGNWRMPTSEEYKELFLNTDVYLVPNDGEEIKGTAQEQSGSVTIEWVSYAEGTSKGVKFYKKGDKQTYMFVPAAGGAAKVLCRVSVSTAACGLLRVTLLLFSLLGTSTSVRTTAASSTTIGTMVFPCVGSWLSSTHFQYQNAA